MAESPDHVTCREVTELVTAYVERALPADETALFEQHLNFCDGCVWYVDQVRTTINVVGDLRAEDVPEETKAKLMVAFRDWKRR